MNKMRLFIKKINKMLLTLSIALLFLFTQSSIGQTSVAYKNAEEAMQAAQKNKQYLILLFYDKKAETLNAMETTVNEFLKTISEKPLFYQVQTTDDKEKETIRKYGISRVPLPLLLVFAPNGAITGGFPEQVKTQELKKCFSVNELDMKIMKPLQEKKIVLVLLQNKKTKFNQESDKVATDFQNDSRLKGYVEIVRADPDNSKNKKVIV